MNIMQDPMGSSGGAGGAGATGATGATGPAHQFEWALLSTVASTNADSTNKLSIGRKYIDPTDVSWGTGSGSTISCDVELETTNTGNAAHAELYQLTGTGSPQVIATLPTSSSLTPTKVSVSVNTAFRPASGVAGDYAIRIWLATANGTDYATASNAVLKVTP